MVEKDERRFLCRQSNRRMVGFLIALCLLLFAVFEARAAVAEDSVSSNGAFDNLGVTTLSWSHTIGTGSSRALFVGVSTSNTVLGTFPIQRVTSVTYGAQTLTRIGTQISSDFRNAVEIFRLVAPASGVDTITVSLVPGSTNYVVGGAISFSGVNQTTPNGAFQSASGNSSTPAVTVSDSVPGDLVLSVLAASPVALNFVPQGAGHLLRWEGSVFFGGTFDIGAGSIKPGATPVVTMNWQMTFADNWALGALAVKAAAPTAATVTIGGRVLTPAGKGAGGTRVVLTESDGSTRTAVTNPFGFYRFEDVAAGQTVTLEARSKRFEFAPQVVAVTEEMKELNFRALSFKAVLDGDSK